MYYFKEIVSYSRVKYLNILTSNAVKKVKYIFFYFKAPKTYLLLEIQLPCGEIRLKKNKTVAFSFHRL